MNVYEDVSESNRRPQTGSSTLVEQCIAMTGLAPFFD